MFSKKPNFKMMKNTLLAVIIISSLNSCSDNNENSNKKDKNNITKSNESNSNQIVPKKITEKVIRLKDTKSGFVVGKWYYNDDARANNGDHKIYGRYKETQVNRIGHEVVVFDKCLVFNYNSMAYQGRCLIEDFNEYFESPKDINNFLAHPTSQVAVDDLIVQIKKYKQTEESRSTDGSDELIDINDAEIQP